MRAVPSPARGLATPGLLGGGLVVITNDNAGVADALAKRLRQQGAHVVVGLIDQHAHMAQAVICLEGLSPLSSDVGASAAQAEQINFNVFAVARAVATRFAAEGGTFITVQDTGGDFGLSGSPRAWAAGPAALVRTAAVEWPQACVRAIDLPWGARSSEQMAEALAHELLWGAPEREVGLSPTAGRVRVALESAPFAAEATRPLNRDDVAFVVATGGARGVTAACLLQLAHTAPARILLLGRTPLQHEPDACAQAKTETDLKRALALAAKQAGQNIDLASIGRQANQILAVREINANINQLHATGSEVHYAVVDATNNEAVRDAVAERRLHWGPVTAVVHGAGVLADKLIAAKTDAQFARVMATKVAGLRALLAATQADPLRLLLLFSSVAARSGNLGQCDYAMANEVLNKVAAFEQNRRGGNAIVRALGWGPWDGGMVDDGLRARFAAMGVGLINVGAGAQAFCDECTSVTRNPEVILGNDVSGHGLAGPESGRTFACELLVGPQTHGYLDGHRIKGVPVVPMALVLEWFARTAMAFKPNLQVWALRNVKVLRGLRLPRFDQGHAERVSVVVRQLSNGGQTSVSLELLASDGAKLYAATCDLRDHAHTPDHMAALPTDLAPHQREIYGQAPLFHGPSFHMLQSLDGKGANGLVATVVGVHDKQWPAAFPLEHASWHIDAALVDAALQLALLWTHESLGGVSLPTGLEALCVYAPGPAQGRLRAVLHAREGRGARCVADVAFLDATGTLVMELRGVETHVIAAAEPTAPPALIT